MLRIRHFEYMGEMPYATSALSMLRKVARRVEPIMVHRGYRVGFLCEFFHSDGKLGMNENGGERIYLRLRSSLDDSAFLDFEEVVGTMLHELAHNVYGSHGEDFCALLEEHMVEYAVLTVASRERKDEFLRSAKGRVTKPGTQQQQDGGLVAEVERLGEAQGGKEKRRTKTHHLEPENTRLGAINIAYPSVDAGREALAEPPRADGGYPPRFQEAVAVRPIKLKWDCPWCTFVNSEGSRVCEVCDARR